MQGPDYVFEFAGIQASRSEVRFVDHLFGNETTIYVSIDDHVMVSLPSTRILPILADMVDLAAAVYVADRLSTSRVSQCRHIHLVLPVRHPELLNCSAVTEWIASILYMYTEDEWSFEFTARSIGARLSERQPVLVSEVSPAETTEVALWSGGLDALAGLYSRMKGSDSSGSYTVFGTGGNRFIHKVQYRVFRAAEKEFPRHIKLPARLVRVPVRVTGTKYLKKNSAPRARGFVFLLLGAVCATLAHQNELHVYENGIGAINLPFRPSEVGIDHSRAVHPLTLRQMGRFVSCLLESSFAFRNPFEFSTKAELCADLIQDRVISPIHRTVSCDRRHRSIPAQCGQCSSCLLRRQALAVNGVIEPADRYVATALPARGAPLPPSASLHLRAMLCQLTDLREALGSPMPWYHLARLYPDLVTIADEIAGHDHLPIEAVQQSIMRMYGTYADEWESARCIVGRELLFNGERVS